MTQKNSLFQIFAAAVALLLPQHPVHAELNLPAIFSDNMVLQASVPVPVWGNASPDVPVTGTFTDEKGGELAKATTTSGASGQWTLTLPALPSGISGQLEIQSGDGNLKLFKNILTGDVWVASGQSNMEWTIAKSADPELHLKQSVNPRIRFFTVERKSVEEPDGVVPTRLGWVQGDASNLADFSAVAFHFGRTLAADLDKPIGIISSAWGGTWIESWIPEGTLQELPEGRASFKTYAERLANKENLKAEHARKLAEWKANGQQGRRPRDRTPYHPRYRPSGPFYGMIEPLGKFPITGVIWYQGEANVMAPEAYEVLFPALINAWRDHWQNPDLPFIYVELAGFRQSQTNPVENSDWARLRWAQRKAFDLPDVAMASAIDVGEENNLHPGDKVTVGQRLAKAALALHYKHPNGELSPRPIAVSQREDGMVFVQIADNSGDFKVTDKDARAPFALQDASGRIDWASFEIVDEGIVLSHPEIKNPVAAYHAWSHNPKITVYTESGLPLPPFHFRLDEGGANPGSEQSIH